jgi:hypothetical protein
MSNRLEQQAAGGTGASSLTKESTAHLIAYQGRPVKWKWMDTPGDLFRVRHSRSVTVPELGSLPTLALVPQSSRSEVDVVEMAGTFHIHIETLTFSLFWEAMR